MHTFLASSPSLLLLLSALFLFLLFPALFPLLSADPEPHSDSEPPEPTRPRAHSVESESDEQAAQEEREIDVDFELASGRVARYINGRLLFLKRPRRQPHGFTVARQVLYPIPEGNNGDEEGEEREEGVTVIQERRRRVGFKRRVLRGFRRVFTCACF